MLKFPIEAGIEPERLLADKSRYISLERFPNWEGMVPKSELLVRLRLMRLCKNEKLKVWRVPFKPAPGRFT